MKKIGLMFLVVFLVATSSFAQLLNKLKNKANQEVNKLENGATSSPTQETPPTKNKLSANVTRTVVLKLGADEGFDYRENCIDLGASLDQVSFIIKKQSGDSYEYYTYKNGTRTPFVGSFVDCRAQTSECGSHPELRLLEPNSDEFKKYVSNETESHAIQQSSVSDEQMKAMAAYLTPAQLDEMKKKLAEGEKQVAAAGQSYSTIKSSTITFNGKKYGPFKLVQKIFLTSDSRVFYAIVGESKSANSEQMQNKMITSASTKTLVLGDNDSPTTFALASADNSEFGCVAINGLKYVITVSSGKTYEIPFSVLFWGAWFSATGNHVLSLSSPDQFSQIQLYFDGQVIKTFTTDQAPSGPCDLFVSSDGKGSTQIKDNTLSFSDGDYFEYPLKVAIVYASGKPYYKWLALENKEMVVYQKPY